MSLWIGLASSIIFIFIAGYCVPHASRLVSEVRLRKIVRQRHAIVLTFDDGPSTLTKDILNALSDHNALATFFMLGRRADENPEIVAAVAAAGHDVGSHSYQHLNGWTRSPWQVLLDTTRGMKATLQWESKPPLFRPPYGKLTAWVWYLVRARSVRLCWWTVDSGDTWDSLPNPEKVAADIITAGGAVVLLHDLSRSPERDAYVLQLIREVLGQAQRAGFSVLPLTQLIRC